MGRNKRLALAFWRSVNGTPPTPVVLPPMSYEEFLAALRNTPRTWRLVENGWIRAGDDDCPITEVVEYITERKYMLDAWTDAANALRLPLDVARQIWHAADNRPGYHDSQVRRDLLVATGLLTDPLDAELAALVASHEQEPAEEPTELVPA